MFVAADGRLKTFLLSDSRPFKWYNMVGETAKHGYGIRFRFPVRVSGVGCFGFGGQDFPPMVLHMLSNNTHDLAELSTAASAHFYKYQDPPM